MESSDVDIDRQLQSLSRDELFELAKYHQRMYNKIRDFLTSTVETFDILPPEKVYEFCQSLDTQALSRFVLTSRRHHEICQEILNKRKATVRVTNPYERGYDKEVHVFNDKFVNFLNEVTRITQTSFGESIMKGVTYHGVVKNILSAYISNTIPRDYTMRGYDTSKDPLFRKYFGDLLIVGSDDLDNLVTSLKVTPENWTFEQKDRYYKYVDVFRTESNAFFSGGFGLFIRALQERKYNSMN